MSPRFDIHLSYLAQGVHQWHCSAKQLTLRSFFVQHQYMIPVYFLRLRMSAAYYIMGQWGELIKKCYLMLTYTFQVFLFVFHRKIWAFIISISSFDEVSNSWNRILTNQKHELASRPWLSFVRRLSFVRISEGIPL